MAKKKDYSNLLKIDHWNPKKYPRMAVENRAEQFQPFDFSGQTKIDKDISAEKLKLTGDYDKGLSFDEDNDIVE